MVVRISITTHNSREWQWMTQHTGSSLGLQLDKNWCWTYQAISPWIEYPLLHRCTGLWSLSVQPLSGPMSCHNVAKVPQSLMCTSMPSSNTHKKAVRAYLMLRFACTVEPAALVRTFWLCLLPGHSHVWRPVCIVSLFQSWHDSKDVLSTPVGSIAGTDLGRSRAYNIEWIEYI